MALIWPGQSQIRPVTWICVKQRCSFKSYHKTVVIMHIAWTYFQDKSCWVFGWFTMDCLSFQRLFWLGFGSSWHTGRCRQNKNDESTLRQWQASATKREQKDRQTDRQKYRDMLTMQENKRDKADRQTYRQTQRQIKLD